MTKHSFHTDSSLLYLGFIKAWICLSTTHLSHCSGDRPAHHCAICSKTAGTLAGARSRHCLPADRATVTRAKVHRRHFSYARSHHASLFADYRCPASDQQAAFVLAPQPHRSSGRTLGAIHRCPLRTAPAIATPCHRIRGAIARSHHRLQSYCPGDSARATRASSSPVPRRQYGSDLATAAASVNTRRFIACASTRRGPQLPETSAVLICRPQPHALSHCSGDTIAVRASALAPATVTFRHFQAADGGQSCWPADRLYRIARATIAAPHRRGPMAALAMPAKPHVSRSVLPDSRRSSQCTVSAIVVLVPDLQQDAAPGPCPQPPHIAARKASPRAITRHLAVRRPCWRPQLSPGRVTRDSSSCLCHVSRRCSLYGGQSRWFAHVLP